MMQFLNQFAASCATKGLQIIPSWYKYIEGNQTSNGCELTFNFPADIPQVLAAVVEIILRVGALVAVGFVIYGGFQYMLSQGEPDRTKNARNTIINAVIGLVIAIFATIIVNFVGGRLTS
jgi:hypothetical protein